MSPSPRNRNAKSRVLRHALEYWTLWLTLRVLACFSARGHARIARAGAFFYDRFLPVRRKVLDQNLRIAFGNPSEQRLRALRRKTCENTILFACELARMAHGSIDQLIGNVRLDEVPQKQLDEAFSGGGALLASGHIGNWEWMAAWAGTYYGKMGVIYKPLHNPRVDELIRTIRERCGMTVISTREQMPRLLLQFLRRGGVVAMLSDQDARGKGQFIPFFGRPSSTAVGLAALAIRLKLPIIVCFGLRTADGRLRIETSPPLWPDATADPDVEQLRLMNEYQRMLEEKIRQYPEQYFWWHNRWKTQPRRNPD